MFRCYNLSLDSKAGNICWVFSELHIELEL